jgi:NADH-quinone oxidoreductase subunit A
MLRPLIAKRVNLHFPLSCAIPIFGPLENAGTSSVPGHRAGPPNRHATASQATVKHSRREGPGMEALLREYLPILIFLGLAMALSGLMVGASYIAARQRPDAEKISPYECGFDPFDDARGKFDVRFYLVAILFIIFDLEVAFLFPWAVTLGEIGLFGFWSMVVFLGVLTIGFIYEWKKGALEWE